MQTVDTSSMTSFGSECPSEDDTKEDADSPRNALDTGDGCTNAGEIRGRFRYGVNFKLYLGIFFVPGGRCEFAPSH